MGMYCISIPEKFFIIISSLKFTGSRLELRYVKNPTTSVSHVCWDVGINTVLLKRDNDILEVSAVESRYQHLTR